MKRSAQNNKCSYFRSYHKEHCTICANVDDILEISIPVSRKEKNLKASYNDRDLESITPLILRIFLFPEFFLTEISTI